MKLKECISNKKNKARFKHIIFVDLNTFKTTNKQSSSEVRSYRNVGAPRYRGPW